MSNTQVTVTSPEKTKSSRLSKPITHAIMRLVLREEFTQRHCCILFPFIPKKTKYISATSYLTYNSFSFFVKGSVEHRLKTYSSVLHINTVRKNIAVHAIFTRVWRAWEFGYKRICQYLVYNDQFN